MTSDEYYNRPKLLERKPDKVMEHIKFKNLPNKIYLNVGDIYTFEEEVDFKELDEVTWCEDKIDDNDIEYFLQPVENLTDLENLQNDLTDFADWYYKNTNSSVSIADVDIDKYLKSRKEN
jgi:hypothetical protein